MTNKVGLTRTTAALCIVGVLALGVAGCGSSKKDGTAATGKPSATDVKNQQGTILNVTIKGGKFVPSTLAAPAGAVTIMLLNPKTEKGKHNIAVKGGVVKVQGGAVAPGKLASLTTSYTKGKYKYYDPTDGGLSGTLTVTAAKGK